MDSQAVGRCETEKKRWLIPCGRQIGIMAAMQKIYLETTIPSYLVTWNCSHLANGEMIQRLLKANAELKCPTPLVVTPEEILESLED